jgi:acetyltransferase-like isoleucine patch superfamily enzyme
VNRTARIGRHVLLNVGAIVSHDVVVEDFVTISPGCSIGGGTLICGGAFIGIGATVRDHVRIGRDAVVAAGAVVVTDVADTSVVAGLPARQMRKSR